MPIFNEEMYLYDKNQNSDLFHLHSFGRLFPDADYIISLKDNSNTIIECVTDGVGYIEHNGTVTTVEKGDCYIIKKGSGYSYYSDDKKPYSKVWVTVYGSLIDRWLDFYNIDHQVYIKHLDITSYYSQIKQTALGRDMLDNDKKLMLLVHGIIFEMAMATPANSRSREDAPHIKTADKPQRGENGGNAVCKLLGCVGFQKLFTQLGKAQNQSSAQCRRKQVQLLSRQNGNALKTV